MNGRRTFLPSSEQSTWSLWSPLTNVAPSPSIPFFESKRGRKKEQKLEGSKIVLPATMLGQVPHPMYLPDIYRESRHYFKEFSPSIRDKNRMHMFQIYRIL